MRARRAHSRGNTDNCRWMSLAHCYLYARPFSTPTQEATLIIAVGPFASLLQVLKPTRRPTQETTLSVVWRPSRYALVFTVLIWTVHLCSTYLTILLIVVGRFSFILFKVTIILNLFCDQLCTTSDHKSLFPYPHLVATLTSTKSH